ncbi:thiocillin family RiPP [Krasilnikovia sp. MM14-A1259]|uniref:thiocillin family RiPP n=1 Tax=Krasilnikovia sp. MM14-A1259 TaxID=3373539 RepID=UPI00399D3D22
MQENIDLFSEDLSDHLSVESLDEANLLGTWTSSTTVSSASCPESTVSSSSTASCAG